MPIPCLMLFSLPLEQKQLKNIHQCHLLKTLNLKPSNNTQIQSPKKMVMQMVMTGLQSLVKKLEGWPASRNYMKHHASGRSIAGKQKSVRTYIHSMKKIVFNSSLSSAFDTGKHNHVRKNMVQMMRRDIARLLMGLKIHGVLTVPYMVILLGIV